LVDGDFLQVHHAGTVTMETVSPLCAGARRLFRWLAGFCAVAVLFFTTASASAANYYAMLQTNLYGDLNQHDLTLYPTMSCGPASAANALAYMQAFNPAYYSNLVPGGGYSGLLSLGNTLVGTNYMSTDNVNGTWHDNLIAGEVKYIEGLDPNVTVYSAQDYWSWSHQTRPSWVSYATPTWNFLYQDLLDNDAIEILLTYYGGGGHFVTVNGFAWNDINSDGIIDSSENARLYFMNPWTGSETNVHIWQSGAGAELETDYGSSWISTTFAASVVPEPSAAELLLAGAGVVAIGRFCRFWRLRRGSPQP
jgi:hypothetical protein